MTHNLCVFGKVTRFSTYTPVYDNISRF